MNSRTRRLGALLAVLALGAAACGDDDKTQAGTSDTTEAPTKAAFIAAADEICSANNDQTEEVMGPIFSGEPQPAMVQEGLGKVLDLSGKMIADLRALTTPKGDEAKIDALLDEGEQLEGTLRAKNATPEGAMELANAEEDPFGALNEKMMAYGFKDCAGEGEPTTETYLGDELSPDDQATAFRVAVKAVDYRYEGVLPNLPLGPAVFTLTNAGSENHEFGLVKIKAGVTVEEAIAKAKADREDQSYVDRFIGAAYALPGEHTDLSAQLDAGLYGFACFVEDADGKPHVMRDMIGYFKVAG